MKAITFFFTAITLGRFSDLKTSDNVLSVENEKKDNFPIILDISNPDTDPRCEVIEYIIDGIHARLYLPGGSYVDNLYYKEHLLWESDVFESLFIYAIVYLENGDPKLLHVVHLEDVRVCDLYMKRAGRRWSNCRRNYDNVLRNIRNESSACASGPTHTKLPAEQIDVNAGSNQKIRAFRRFLYGVDTLIHMPVEGHTCTRVVHGDFVFWETSPGYRCLFTLTLFSRGEPVSVYLFLKDECGRSEHHYHKKYDKWIHVELSKSGVPHKLIKPMGSSKEGPIVHHQSSNEEDVLDLYQTYHEYSSPALGNVSHRVFLPMRDVFKKVMYGETIIWNAQNEECILVETFYRRGVYIVKLGIDHLSKSKHLYFERINDEFAMYELEELLSKYEWLQGKDATVDELNVNTKDDCQV
ncbi:hypothetical protein BEWA_035880 [Theileria equi strain WA]|uniref:Signal peptide-containing protein n=1 Tax=Theileria equi strain WA TaxID=1537102 RepID=L1LDM5_THEEQ|nr:hypothetical protein BEWA_035880 [Theileria equi strain WA]EKX73552.1 hypothetical protein BEWA_035880 [Theileria equi strain WA]|eukprot:XP_004833004.1 hypothetical protein BEWA_035880 [Theileria equi strain WA]